MWNVGSPVQLSTQRPTLCLNLDSKNPHEVAVYHGDPDELMREYDEIASQLTAAQNALKAELMRALGTK